ncbi:protein phosphatase 1 regulatory subunit 3A [Monodelphis domestica]|uniref:protein phosphatase 1 regulatory subunit 3A n=1 Tax=Monodelphis domestica TaxID=13616 RepID=UPI0024E250F0|nr:protein phosphatase 1 regulatory subunit 3A [Monodelphis domestica]
MEPSEETVQINKDNFLEVPSLSDSLSEDEEIKETLKPRFSPLPRRRGSDSSESDYPYLDTPSSGSRRVSFADALGFNLVSIKEFDSWDPLPGISSHFDLRNDVFHTDEYILSPLFDLPSSKEVLMQELQVQKAILESTEFLTGATTLKGTIRVLNVSFEKSVYVRMSLDDWQTHYDILAEYIPNSCDGETDQFSFKISLVPPYQKDGARIEFCIRYETSLGTFWSNNNGKNYTLVCQKKEREKEPEKSPEVITNRQLKGCLKVKSSKEESLEILEENNCNNSRITDTSLPTIIFSHEDKEDTGASSQNVKDVNRADDESREKELELMLNEYSVRTRSPSSKEESSFATEPVNFPNTVEEFENQRTLGEMRENLLRRPLSSSSSAENPLRGELYSDPKYSLRNEVSHQLAEGLTSGLANNSKPSGRYTDSGETTPLFGNLLVKQQDEHSHFLEESERQGIKWVDISKSKTDGAMGNEMMDRLFTSQEDAHSYKKAHKMTLETFSSEDNKLVPLSTSDMEVLDDNANPAGEGQKLQTSGPTANLPLAGNADQGKEGERTKEIKIKDWECPTKEFHSYVPTHMNVFKECPVTEKRTSRKSHANIKEKEAQRIKFGVSERQNENMLPISTDHQGRRPERGANDMSQVSNRSLNDSWSKVNEISASSSDLASRADRSHSLRTDLAKHKDVFTTQRSGLVDSEGNTPERIHGQVCLPENGNVLQPDPNLPQDQREKSDRKIPDDQNKIECGNQSWNVLESQVILRESKTNRTEQIKEHADGKDMWEIRDKTRSPNVTPTEELFTCQETVRCELSSVADHGITEKAEAGTAYIIKTTSESTLESMSARAKAIIAKLPQETSLSDRPTEEKETAFDPHEGRNDDSHYTLCHRDSVDVIYDIDFEKKSHLGIYNVHIDEKRKEETMSQCNPGEILDRAEDGIRNIATVGESLQVTPENGKASSELDFYSAQLPTLPKILKKNICHGQSQGLPQKNAGLVPLAHQSFHSERSICSQNSTPVSTHLNKTQSNEETFTIEYPMAAMPFKSISTTSECKCDLHSEAQCVEKNLHPGSVPQEYHKSSAILTSSDGKERFRAERFQQAENNMAKSLGPLIFISEPNEEVEETSCETEELINYGQELASSSFKLGNSSDSSILPTQDNQTLASESLLSKFNSKILYFLLFLLFLLTSYYYDLMIGLAFYLFSLYWLSWEGGQPQEPVKKK